MLVEDFKLIFKVVEFCSIIIVVVKLDMWVVIVSVVIKCVEVVFGVELFVCIICYLCLFVVGECFLL